MPCPPGGVSRRVDVTDDGSTTSPRPPLTADSVHAVEVDPVITCIDCGGRAHLISYPPTERAWEPGDLAVYRCEDCLDRWDLVVPDEDPTAARGDDPGWP